MIDIKKKKNTDLKMRTIIIILYYTPSVCTKTVENNKNNGKK